MPDHPDSSDLQFDRAEALPSAGPVACVVCKKPIDAPYYELNRRVVCARCRDLLLAALAKRTGGAIMPRAVLFGVGAAIAGAILSFAVTAATGYSFGLAAIAVGYFVGKAVKKGARGEGGGLYQVLAMVLTYVAMVASYIPAGLDFSRVNWGRLFVVLLRAPFTAGGVIGLFIVGIALYEAWKFTQRPIRIWTGPHAITSSVTTA